MQQIVIVVFEPEKSTHEGLRRMYRGVFNSLEYEPIFRFCVERDSVPVLLRSERCDVVICDLAIGNRRDFQGLNLIQGIKEQWPEIVCIGNTEGGDLTYAKTSAKLPTFDIFVDKAKLFGGDRAYLRFVEADLAKRIASNHNIVIDEERSTFSRHVSQSEMREVESIIKQITFTGHHHDESLNLQRATLTPLQGGRSRSMVFKLDLWSDTKIPSIPAVLKVSKVEYAIKELNNYMNYVKWFIPAAWRAEVIGFGASKTYGGICYAFVTEEGDEFNSLTKAIEGNNEYLLNVAMDNVLNRGRQVWHKSALIEKEGNINERYCSRYFAEPWFVNISGDVFLEIVQKNFGGVIAPGEIRIREKRFPLPRLLLFGRPHGEYYSCICHGDMNSNNIIVSNKGRMIIIDFQDTARGHVFEDYIALEASIRMYLPYESEPHQLLELEVALTRDQREETDARYAYYIRRIREAAYRNFPMERRTLYAYAVAAYHFRLLRVEGLTEVQKVRIAAAIIAAMDQLT